MSARTSIRRLLARRVLGKPLGVWLLWTAAVAVLAGCPVIISDPGMWPYLFDPELLALVVVVGVQYTRLEFGVLCVQVRGWWAGRAAPRLSGCRQRSVLFSVSSPPGSYQVGAAVYVDLAAEAVDSLVDGVLKRGEPVFPQADVVSERADQA